MLDDVRLFFRRLDRLLIQKEQKASIVLIGGIAGVLGYGLLRKTRDVDFLGRVPHQVLDLWDQCVKDTGVELYIDSVSVAACTDDLESRLAEISEISGGALTVYVPEIYDYILMKLSRAQERDVADCLTVARKNGLDCSKLVDRYLRELRPIFIGSVTNMDLSIIMFSDELWGPDVAESIARRLE